jgi:hypothetical protein
LNYVPILSHKMTAVLETSDFHRCLQKGLIDEIKNLRNEFDHTIDSVRISSMKEKIRHLTWMLKLVKSGDKITKMVLIEIVETEIKRYKRQLNLQVTTKPEEMVYDAIESLEWLRTAIISTDTKKFNNLAFYRETILTPNQLETELIQYNYKIR